MNRLLMSNKIPFLSCQIFTLWTLKSLAYVYRFLMNNKVVFFVLPDIHTLDIGTLCPNEQISHVLQGGLSWLHDVYTLSIGIFGPYAQIFYGKQGHFTKLPDMHTLDTEISLPYARISDGKQGFFFKVV